MKTRILTFAALFLMTASIATADNFRSFKMSDRLGRTIEVLTKVENNIQETFEFNTREVFDEVKKSNNNQMIDITPFVKPEREVKESHPVNK
ncbi:MAG: hypothetical protein EA361_04120 [Bacteroidetes bacterium]|nr:MAG: hypothetical protein EA361_04120 [Bacteroidota bacterium]